MKLYLAGISGAKKWIQDKTVNPEDINCLESYVSIKDWQVPLIPRFKSFILDSGAFTFMNTGKKNIDWYRYAEEYANFVLKNQIGLYFELDIDKIIGLKEIDKLRTHIERIVGWPSIPVWHDTRDKEYWFNMIRNYPYVALGGMAGAADFANRKKFEKVFPWFIQTAHKHGTKIHGLGYTDTSKLSIYRFDSTDSTTWTAGQRFGQLHTFKNGKIEKISSVNNGIKTLDIRDMEAVSFHNFKEWIKFSKYLERI